MIKQCRTRIKKITNQPGHVSVFLHLYTLYSLRVFDNKYKHRNVGNPQLVALGFYFYQVNILKFHLSWLNPLKLLHHLRPRFLLAQMCGIFTDPRLCHPSVFPSRPNPQGRGLH